MSSQAPALNPCLCPLCGQPNGCAMEKAKQTGEPVGACWCVNISFAPELLARVPESAKRQACICQACATSAPST